MKIVVIQEEIIQTDITPKELTERWKKLEQLPGIDEVVIEVPAHYPNIEQLHTYIGDADAVFGLWIGPDNMNEAFKICCHLRTRMGKIRYRNDQKTRHFHFQYHLRFTDDRRIRFRFINGCLPSYRHA